MNGCIPPPPVLTGTPFKWHECKDCGKTFLSIPPNCLFWIKCPKCGSANIKLYKTIFDIMDGNIRW